MFKFIYFNKIGNPYNDTRIKMLVILMLFLIFSIEKPIKQQLMKVNILQKVLFTKFIFIVNLYFFIYKFDVMLLLSSNHPVFINIRRIRQNVRIRRIACIFLMKTTILDCIEINKLPNLPWKDSQLFFVPFNNSFESK